MFEFLLDLENHWLLTDRFIEVLALERSSGGAASGGRVRMHGPLGSWRTVTTRVVEADPQHSISGTADLGGSRARVTWRLTPEGSGTRVALEARVERVGWLDRLLLELGGRRWIQRRFGAILVTLAGRFANGR